MVNGEIVWDGGGPTKVEAAKVYAQAGVARRRMWEKLSIKPTSKWPLIS